MNKAMLVVVIVLSVTVVLLSGAVFYFSQCKCQHQFSPGFNPGSRMNTRMPFPSEQERPVPGNMPPMLNAGGQSDMTPPGGQPNLMGGPTMGGGQQGQQGQRPQGRPIMGGGRQGQGQQGGQGMGGQQGPGQQSGQMSGSMQNQAGSREQVSKLMQDANQEAQSYFMSQNRKPEHQEMLSKVKELLAQKMNAQGISQDIQQQVFNGMNQAGPPQQPQQRP